VTVAPNPLYRVIADVRYAGMRFRTDGDDLYVSGATDRLSAALTARIKHHKPAIIAALNRIPDGCVVPHVCMDIGACNSDCCEQSGYAKPLPKPCRKDEAA